MLIMQSNVFPLTGYHVEQQELLERRGQKKFSLWNPLNNMPDAVKIEMPFSLVLELDFEELVRRPADAIEAFSEIPCS